MLEAARGRDVPRAVEILHSHLRTAAATLAAFFAQRG
jgi:DNA-binding GntR family transcriptional regulator